MEKIKYVKGDATNPIGDGKKIIAHVCNDIGAFGAGFVLAISAKWKQPEKEYRMLSPKKRVLGNVQLIPVTNDIIVANMIAQSKTSYNEYNVPPVRYGAIEVCLKQVFKYAESTNTSVHMPSYLVGNGILSNLQY